MTLPLFKTIWNLTTYHLKQYQYYKKSNSINYEDNKQNKSRLKKEFIIHRVNKEEDIESVFTIIYWRHWHIEINPKSVRRIGNESINGNRPLMVRFGMGFWNSKVVIRVGIFNNSDWDFKIPRLGSLTIRIRILKIPRLLLFG